MIPGLRYAPDYLDVGEHDRVLGTVSGSGWQDAGGRRIQFYGHWYHHAKACTLSATCRIGAWPSRRVCATTG